MSFVEECVQGSLPTWAACLQTPFLQGMAEGTLDEGLFKGYLVEDSLYLRGYAKVFAWGMLHAGTMQEIRSYYSLLAFVNEGEGSTRRQYLKRYGLSDEAIQPLPPRPENAAYLQTMLQAAQQGPGAAECMMAALPCMLSYRWIFERLVQQAPGVLQGPFAPFVQDYLSERYAGLCRQWSAFADAAAGGLDGGRLGRCREIFAACSGHELRFWQMCGQPRQDC